MNTHTHSNRAKPIVVVHEQQLEHLPLGEGAACAAVAQDGGSVMHVHVGAPAGRPTGAPLRARVVVVEAARFAEQARALDRMCVVTSDRGARTPALSLLVAHHPDGRVAELAAYLGNSARTYACELVRVPRVSDLFSRTQGLLESSALAKKTVAIVGVGSGGSAIAVDLARAGVGSFVLVDPERLELANVMRHAAGIGDLGRLKVNAVADLLRDRNPHVDVSALPLDVNVDSVTTRGALAHVDLLIGATDERRSRAFVNRLALDLGKPAIFGRAIPRAAGGDVLRVRPFAGPCLTCIFEAGLMSGEDEVSSARRAENAPAYTSHEDRMATVQPGLATDIAPLANLMTKLALHELSRGTSVDTVSMDADLSADFFIWANRRERAYASWPVMGTSSRTPSILRWYGCAALRQATCLECGVRPSSATTFELHDGPRDWSEGE